MEPIECGPGNTMTPAPSVDGSPRDRPQGKANLTIAAQVPECLKHPIEIRLKLWSIQQRLESDATLRRHILEPFDLVGPFEVPAESVY